MPKIEHMTTNVAASLRAELRDAVTGFESAIKGFLAIAPKLDATLELVERTLTMAEGMRGVNGHATVATPTATTSSTWDGLNAKEQAALGFLASSDGWSATVVEIGARCFLRGRAANRAKNERQARSWARNALRRPLRDGLVERIGGGNYRATSAGKSLLKERA